MLNLIQKCASHRGTRVMNSLVAEFLMFCYRIFLLLARSVVHSSGNVCLCFPTLLCSYSVVFMDDFDSWRKAAPTSRWEKHCPERDLYWPLPHQHEGRRFGTGHKVTVMVVMFWRTVLLLLEWRRVCHYFKGCMLWFPWSMDFSAMCSLLQTDQSKLQSQVMLVTLTVIVADARGEEFPYLLEIFISFKRTSLLLL